MRIIQFPTWRKSGRAFLSAILIGQDPYVVAAVCWNERDFPQICWYDFRKEAVVDSTYGTSLAEDEGPPPEPAISPNLRFVARMANERGGIERLEFVDREDRKKPIRKLTAWPYEEYGGQPEGFSSQIFMAMTFSPDGEFLYAAVGGGDLDDETKHADDLGIYRWTVSRILKGRGKKSGGGLLPDPDFFLGMAQPDSLRSQVPRQLVVSHDGKTLAAGLWNKRIRIWDLASAAELPEPRLKKRKVPHPWRLALASDGKSLAYADETVSLHDMPSNKPRATLPAGPAVMPPFSSSAVPFVFDLAINHAGNQLVPACGDSIVRWFDATSGAELGRFDWGIGAVTAVSFSPDGNICAAGGQEGQVAFWDVGR